jgi:hypothetical protein
MCSSRPYEKQICCYNKCKIGLLIKKQKRYGSAKNVEYRVDCMISGNFYLGETERTLHWKIGENSCYASYQETPSNRNQALAIRYREIHVGIYPNLSCTILILPDFVLFFFVNVSDVSLIIIIDVSLGTWLLLIEKLNIY